MTGADVEALSRSFRSRIALWVLLVLAGLAAALWSSTRKVGVGEPEDRRKLMVVTRDGDVNYYAVLERAGFEVEVDDYDDWLAEARAAAPESEAEGVALVLELADLRGFGLVVFERPAELDFGDVELEPDIADVEQLDERDYAVLSVGDFGFPHRLTVDEVGAHAQVRLPGYGALEAVFRQELIGAREDPDRPTVEELQFEDAISLGRQMFERPAEFEATIAATRATIEAALDDGSRARALVPTLATGTAVPTPDGGILVFHHDLVIYSANARTLELEAGTKLAISWVAPEALARGELERSACTSLAGGELPMSDAGTPPAIEAAIDGSAIAIGGPEGGMIVWRKREPGCEWSAVAELDREDIVVAPSFAGAAVAATAERDDQQGRVLVWALPDAAKGQDDRLDAQLVLARNGRWFGAPAFLDDRNLVLTSEIREPGMPSEQERIDLLDRTRPGLHLSLAIELFPGIRAFRRVVPLAPASDEAGPELLVEALDREQVQLIRVRIAADAWAQFLAAEPPTEAELGVEGRMLSVAPEQLELDTIVAARIRGPVSLSAAGRSLIYVSRDEAASSELMLVDLDTRERRRLTDNDMRDYLPRLAADGSFATFVSLMQVNISTTPFSVPRVLPLR